MPRREPHRLPPDSPRPPEPPSWATTLSATPPSHDQAHSQPLLPSRLQLAVAILAAVGLAGMALWFLAAGGLSGGLVAYRDTTASGNSSNAAGFRIDLNTASRVELLQLPRVGPALADRIMARRETVGPYTAAEELLSVPGIGEITLTDIRPFLLPLPADTASSPPTATPPPAAGSPHDVRTGQ